MFQRPELLALLSLSIPLLILTWKATRRFKLLTRYFDDSGNKVARLALNSIRVLALLLIALSAAMPVDKRVIREEVPLERAELLSGKRVLLVIMVDVSKSMIGRIERVKSALKEMDFPNTTVHLATFSGEVKPLYTGPAKGMVEVVPRIRAGERFTAIGDALAYARSFALNYPLPSAVILFSDGRQNYGSDPLKVAKGYGVPLVVVSVDEVNVLAKVAELAKGKIYSLDEFSVDYKEFSRELILRSRYLALKRRGQAYIQRELVDYSPTLVVIALSLIAFLASQGDGL